MTSSYLKIAYFLFIFISFSYNSAKCETISKNPLLLFISFDGFRWDYLETYNLKNFNYLKSIGSHADFIYSSFATSTFPNHWTLVTGLFEESHGIISNEMYDPILNETFSMTTSQTIEWYGQNKAIQPIWTLNQKNGNGRLSAAEWVGANVMFNNESIIEIPYNFSTPFNQLIDEFVQLFNNKINPINFGALYFNEPDYTGHYYGPFSKEIKAKLEEVDQNLGYLIEQLKKFNLFDSLNLIITSDHGMENISNQKIIYLNSYVDTSLFEVHGGEVNLNLFLKNSSYLDFVYAKLKQVAHFDVYKKSEIPGYYNYKNNIRVGDLLISAKIGYIIHLNKTKNTLLGQHGYNNNESAMHSIFIASGPSFKKNFKVKNFRNVDIYPLMCKVLKIEPGIHNGSLEIVKEVLIIEKDKYETFYIIISVIPVISASLTAIFLCYMNKPRDVLNMPSINGYMIVSTSELNETLINNNDDDNDNYSGSSIIVS